jgi:hypothetical protein
MARTITPLTAVKNLYFARKLHRVLHALLSNSSRGSYCWISAMRMCEAQSIAEFYIVSLTEIPELGVTLPSLIHLHRTSSSCPEARYI